jgi:putative pyruvate formate lyase activating enzyme
MTPFDGPADFTPAYVRLGLERLRSRVMKAVEGLASCRACPRDCRVNRLEDRWSACKTGRYPVVTSAFPHLGEEDCLRGWNGSGTIFFGHCNLRCAFCQNYDISQGIRPPGQGMPPPVLAGLMLSLQRRGCHNINLVTPEHVVPQLLEALLIAVEQGLRLPIVYNTSAYDSLDTLALLDGVVDIYMPDVKLFSPRLCRLFLKAEDYPQVARAAVLEMHRQVGFLDIDGKGLALRGVLIRHLVLPGFPEETRAILEWIAREVGPETYVNVMGQYRPAGRVGKGYLPELNRPLGLSEYGTALRTAREVGLRRLDTRNAP